MDFREYQNAYKELMLKEQIGTSSRVKKQLIEIIQYSTDKDLLDYYANTNLAESELQAKQQMMLEYKDNPEVLMLLQTDIEMSRRLSAVIAQRKQQLIYENPELTDQNEEKSDIQIATEHSRVSEKMDGLAMAHGDGVIGGGYVMKSTTDPIEYIKFLVANSNQLIRNIRTNLEQEPNLLKVAFLASQTSEFDSIESLARQTENVQGCDEELKALLQEEIGEIQALKETIEKYRQQIQEKTKGKQQGEQNLVIDEGLGLEEGEEQQEQIQPPNEEVVEEKASKEPKRKSWEISPELKEEIQISSRETAQEFVERESSPQPKIEMEHEEGFEK